MKMMMMMMVVMMMTMTMTMMTIRRAHPVFLFPYKALHLKILSALEWDDWDELGPSVHVCVPFIDICMCVYSSTIINIVCVSSSSHVHCISLLFLSLSLSLSHHHHHQTDGTEKVSPASLASRYPQQHGGRERRRRRRRRRTTKTKTKRGGLGT